jgi:hypothetical protein
MERIADITVKETGNKGTKKRGKGGKRKPKAKEYSTE